VTRINIVPVAELTNAHLAAEYRELPRVSNLAWKWQERLDDQIVHNVYRELSDNCHIPEQYTLGKGHVKFFYNKGAYLKNRFENEIVPELRKRGYSLSYTKYRMHPDGLNDDWMPDEEAMAINRARINERLNSKREIR